MSKMHTLQGTLGVICTSIPHKQNPWVLPLSQSRTEDCPRQEKLIYPKGKQFTSN